ncbi:MAG: 3',5'-cyclic-AMP phosphodiesterase [Cyanobacteria bacterium TGS_CYA1]|nr:3',5'-cyclic-AMP phosphodiesterase [Cyanobacteria bacterium TGS_CYA1]
MKILQITDTHLFASGDDEDDEPMLFGFNTFESLKHVIELVKKQENAYDLVVLTGDLSEDETAASYRRLAELLGTLNKPIYYLFGNHDNPYLAREVFGEYPLFKHETEIILENWLVVLLNSKIEGRQEGNISQEELDRLKSLLGTHAEKHALVCMHHNPVNMDPDRFDKYILQNPKEFFAVIDAHTNVRGVLWGHVHQQSYSQRRDVTLMSTPSTCAQFTPNETGIKLDYKPPGYRSLKLHKNGYIETEVKRLVFMPFEPSRS